MYNSHNNFFSSISMHLFNKWIQLINISYKFSDLKCLTHINNCNIIVCVEQYFYFFFTKIACPVHLHGCDNVESFFEYNYIIQRKCLKIIKKVMSKNLTVQFTCDYLYISVHAI